MGHICFAAKNNCYALNWSYGEICVHSNCCGQYGKGLDMWKSRLHFHEVELKRNEEFDNWIKGCENVQRKNVKININYHKRLIKKCKARIEYFKI